MNSIAQFDACGKLFLLRNKENALGRNLLFYDTYQ